VLPFGSEIFSGLVRSLAPAAILLIAVWVGIQDAAGQGAVKSVHGDWQVRCESTSPGQQNQCAVVQTVTAEDRPDVGLTIVVVKTAEHKSPLLRVVAPIGVLLPSGLGLKVDEVDIGRVGFVRCLPNGCVAEVVMDDNLLEKLRGGQTATFIIFLAPDEGLGFPINLQGFGEGVYSLS
jgi:invasion protein IalB